MSRNQSRPEARAMRQTIFSRVSLSDLQQLHEHSLQLDRPISWIVRRALIQSGYLEAGK